MPRRQREDLEETDDDEDLELQDEDEEDEEDEEDGDGEHEDEEQEDDENGQDSHADNKYQHDDARISIRQLVSNIKRNDNDLANRLSNVYTDLRYLTKTIFIARSGKDEVTFYAPISRRTTAHLMQIIQCMQDERRKFLQKPVMLRISTDGGCAFTGLLIHDRLRQLCFPLHTVMDGSVCSAGVIMLLAGSRRYAMPSSSLLIHDVRSDFSGTRTELIYDLATTQSLHETFHALCVERTKIRQDELDKEIKHDGRLNANACFRYGFVHDVLWPRDAKKKPNRKRTRTSDFKKIVSIIHN
jgi:ATP-dependent protease ClpP protease subunit